MATSTRRARLRPIALALLGFAAPLTGAALSATPAAAQSQNFSAFVASLWPEAHARGVSRSTFDAAFAGVTPDPEVIEKTKTQAEFHKTVGQYLETAVSDKRIALGREKYAANERWLAKAEDRFGVDRYIVMGVWGLETKFGTYMGDDYVVRSLATLAYARYRGTYFRTELVKALVILEEGHVDPAHMIGSWAGAMGQTQFMPSNFKPYAVDFEGDGRRDIWNSTPDAVGSTANFLKKHGWIAGETWGYEVQLPAGLAGVASAPDHYAPFGAWAARGVVRADGGEMPGSGAAALLRPAGPAGPAFLVTRNFKVIKSYNNSTSYALGVCLLGDRIAGWGPLKARWPGATLAQTR
ncbi:lytic murein transglycosylase [Lichenibacterium dinghuense]|uniref:lytic murein transglycosylase n=1 Tax=Lichenibacterium dinghuense TaxID=2895977 RepID=UPI001F39CE1A|nr:lytic murein transglycosylase [Lichenibacterium sp. 6Y81]